MLLTYLSQKLMEPCFYSGHSSSSSICPSFLTFHPLEAAIVMGVVFSAVSISCRVQTIFNKFYYFENHYYRHFQMCAEANPEKERRVLEINRGMYITSKLRYPACRKVLWIAADKEGVLMCEQCRMLTFRKSLRNHLEIAI